MCNSHEARAGGFVRPSRAFEVRARRADVGGWDKNVKRPRRRGHERIERMVKRRGRVAKVRPRVRTRGI